MFKSLRSTSSFAKHVVPKRHVFNGMSFWDIVKQGVNPQFDVEDFQIFGEAVKRDFVKDIVPHSDGEFGGTSISKYVYIDEDSPKDKALRFYGSHDIFKVDTTQSQVGKPKLAFNALKVNFNRVLDLRDYEGLEIVCRSTKENQKVVFNMFCVSYNDFDLFQADLELPQANRWYHCVIPFEALQLTLGGNELMQNRNNDSLQMEGFGFLIKNPPQDGPDFCIDTLSITALAQLPDERAQRRKMVDAAAATERASRRN